MDSNNSPLLLKKKTDTVSSFVDFRGHTICHKMTGGWTAAIFIIFVEMAERFAFFGISINLISYLTGPLGQSMAEAATAINAWSGVASLLPLLGAVIADSYIGRYRMIVVASLFYVVGLGMLAFSSVMPNLDPSECGDAFSGIISKPSNFRLVFFYISLYIVAFAEGGHKPCVQAFGADQFDENDPKECIARSSFFNWWYFATNGGNIVTLSALIYIQDNVGWGLGFGIPSFAVLFGLVVFLFGTKTYRFYALKDENPFIRIGRRLVAMVRHRKGAISPNSADDKEAQMSTGDFNLSSQVKEESEVTCAHEEEANRIFKLLPIWATCFIYAVVFAQTTTLFTKQASTLDKRIGSNLEVPPALIQSFASASVIIFMPMYDRILVPVSRKFSRLPSGITVLQRIGTGLVFSMVSMLIAALVETKRLETAKDFGLVDQPKAMIPMSFWWLVPQNVIFGASNVLTMVGLQEFFYDQAPNSLRSLGIGLYVSIFGIGNFISGFLISIIEKVTSKSGHSWFNSNLNKAHLDYFYWLLTGLSALELALFVYFAKLYRYKKKKNSVVL